MSHPHETLFDVPQSVVSPFIGRTEELRTLTDLLDRPSLPQAALLGGDAGIGKTRLLEEFLSRARAAGALTAVGHCIELADGGLPYVPFVSALRALRAALPAEFDAAVAGREAELARLLPELSDPARAAAGDPADSDGRDDDSVGRGRLFELTAQLLRALTAERTLVLALEDLHWSDPSTRQLLGFLVRALGTGRLMLVMTYRSDDIHRRHPLRPFLAELDRLRVVHRLQLAPFSREDTAALLSGLLGGAAEPALVREVFERSEGNAFFAEELLQAIRDGGAEAGLSESLRDLLLVRVERLPESAQLLLRVVAEGGSSVTDRLLAHASGLPEEELIAALRAAIGAHVVEPTDCGGVAGYRFRHALAREAVRDDLLPGERRRLNARYAAVLEADPSLVPCDELAIRLASYWYHAHVPERALPAAMEAARQAGRRSAHSEQLRMLERVLELWEDVPAEARAGVARVDVYGGYPSCGCPGGRDAGHAPGCERAYLDLLGAMVAAAQAAANTERGLRVAGLALSQLAGADPGDAPYRAWFLKEQSRLLRWDRRGNGQAELDAALELVDALPDSEVKAAVLSEGAMHRTLSGRPEVARELAVRALATAERAGSERLLLDTRLRLAMVRFDMGELDDGLDEQRAIREQLLELDPLMYCKWVQNLTDALEYLGRSEEAVLEAQDGLREMARLGYYTRYGHDLTGNLAESLIELGEWGAAEAALEEVDARLPGAAPMHSNHQVMLRAHLQLARGQAAAAADGLARMMARPGEWTWQPQFRVPLYDMRMRTAAALGLAEEERSLLKEALEYPGLWSSGRERYTWPLLARAAEREREPAEREAIAATAARLPRKVPLHDAWAARLAAAQAAGEAPERRAALWGAAEAAFCPLRRPLALAEVRILLAGALGEAGRRPEADERRVLAVEALRGMGACPVAAGAEAGAPSGEGFGLTARERDVLRLVAKGLTNRQIAGELVISAKTASVHVSNILAKLGVSSRGEAAALAHRHGLFPDAA
ncbi:hypothetical protein BIV57_14510 [Mangrovactinospora gilvigrisea]|uniref:HTH luxR-type domain-containing protein n=1 Tax=Mangrovactinospora gilvigrisea TaxID=1428644 RepID=A0A1J7C5C3_9ACTN|nr:LuxR family transcriptional regulator [Mangrovactinospora gilvigrisea]OIV36748.1 hypothetical protein BIV57_14510 [Mangrovactinospora gilvigrisea]